MFGRTLVLGVLALAAAGLAPARAGGAGRAACRSGG